MNSSYSKFLLLAGMAAAMSSLPSPAETGSRSNPQLKPGPADLQDTSQFNRDRIAAAEAKRRRKAAKKASR